MVLYLFAVAVLSFVCDADDCAGLGISDRINLLHRGCGIALVEVFIGLPFNSRTVLGCGEPVQPVLGCT